MPAIVINKAKPRKIAPTTFLADLSLNKSFAEITTQFDSISKFCSSFLLLNSTSSPRLWYAISRLDDNN